MKLFFKQIDIFGTKFHFLTYKKHKFKTFIGGIMTLVIYILAFLIIFFLEDDFFIEKIHLILFQIMVHNMKK